MAVRIARRPLCGRDTDVIDAVDEVVAVTIAGARRDADLVDAPFAAPVVAVKPGFSARVAIALDHMNDKKEAEETLDIERHGIV